MINLKKIWFIVYIFLAIFQPPIIPFPLIYIVGIITIFLLLLKNRGYIKVNILRKSSMLYILKFFIAMVMYIIVISFVDVLILKNDLILTIRMKTISQLLILSTIQFINIYYIITMSKELKYDLDDVFLAVIYAGILQSMASILAYLIPPVRNIFLQFAGNVYSNPYVYERRAYGFSSTLLDTFGYGMGLIAGYVVLLSPKTKFKNIVIISLLTFSIFVNSRTGIVVLAIAIVLKLLKSKRIRNTAFKVVLFLPVIYLITKKFIPIILLPFLNSNSVTTKWVARSVMGLHELIFNFRGIESIENATFLSHFNVLPTDKFTMLFGSGHIVYGTRNLLGFATDVGYINTIWTYGIFGLALFTLKFIRLFNKALRSNRDVDYRFVTIFNMVAYFVVQLKAILIGYNPGIFITYLITFSILYYSKSEILESKIRSKESITEGEYGCTY
ncbi:MAG: hypothetical protein GX347_07370 [Epulopiscium sp.]|nr:hypothetical protein [Candidatus Epulonipiscium sp.]